jgi:ABC-type antimicrobial peptide transport system permease subunit
MTCCWCGSIQGELATPARARETLTLVLLGAAIGVPAAFAAGRLGKALLFGLRPRDPSTMALAAAILLGVALVAGLLPARRATRVDPLTALRAE